MLLWMTWLQLLLQRALVLLQGKAQAGAQLLLARAVVLWGGGSMEAGGVNGAHGSPAAAESPTPSPTSPIAADGQVDVDMRVFTGHDTKNNVKSSGLAAASAASLGPRDVDGADDGVEGQQPPALTGARTFVVAPQGGAGVERGGASTAGFARGLSTMFSRSFGTGGDSNRAKRVPGSRGAVGKEGKGAGNGGEEGEGGEGGKAQAGQLVKEEARAVGTVSWRVYVEVRAPPCLLQNVPRF